MGGIIKDELNYNKVCACWRAETGDGGEILSIPLEILLRRSERFLDRHITVDDSWVHFYEP